MILNTQDINKYKENGFLIIKNYINSSLLDSLKETLFIMFSYNLKNSVNTDRLEELVNKLENEDHNKVYNIQKAISSSTEVITLLNSLKMGELHSDLYGSDKRNIHLTLFQAPVQFPNDNRFDFKWHQEGGSYVGHSNILTCWFPILGPVNKIDGSMTLIPKSHKSGLRESSHIKKASGPFLKSMSYVRCKTRPLFDFFSSKPKQPTQQFSSFMTHPWGPLRPHWTIRAIE